MISRSGAVYGKEKQVRLRGTHDAHVLAGPSGLMRRLETGLRLRVHRV